MSQESFEANIPYEMVITDKKINTSLHCKTVSHFAQNLCVTKDQFRFAAAKKKITENSVFSIMQNKFSLKQTAHIFLTGMNYEQFGLK